MSRHQWNLFLILKIKQYDNQETIVDCSDIDDQEQIDQNTSTNKLECEQTSNKT